MYKIKFIPTGHVFELPKEVALEFKSKYPAEYEILQIDGKDFIDKNIQKNNFSIRAKVVDKEKIS
jgi:hypothetical protein